MPTITAKKLKPGDPFNIGSSNTLYITKRRNNSGGVEGINIDESKKSFGKEIKIPSKQSVVKIKLEEVDLKNIEIGKFFIVYPDPDNKKVFSIQKLTLHIDKFSCNSKEIYPKKGKRKSFDVNIKVLKIS